MEKKERNDCKNVRDFQKRFATGEFEDGSVDKQCEAGWYDWFCEDTSLRAKTASLGKVVSQIKDGGKVDLDRCTLTFKNNCPMAGPLYDDIRIGDSEGNLFVIARDDERNEHKWTVYSYLTDYEALAEFDDSRQLVKWLNEPWDRSMSELIADMKERKGERMCAAVRDIIGIVGSREAVEFLRKEARRMYEEAAALRKGDDCDE